MALHREIVLGDTKIKVPVYSCNTVIAGTGAAGLNCAVRLFREIEETGAANPAEQIAIVTRGLRLGTSNNAGSDKQTYYKLGTLGSEPDSPLDFAKTLCAAGCMHGDVALAEAENSLRAFYHLVDAGVPFPHTEHGAFAGYKTDHDPRRRATSAGPWTSRFMVRKLLAELQRYRVPIFNHHHVVALVTCGEGEHRAVCGLLCVDLARELAPERGLALFHCANVVMAGGGPGELYAASVYPKGQMGPYAALFESGAIAHNLSESQFGLASLHPRWNLSGTYQQVIPRYFSTGADGGDEEDFLNSCFDSIEALAANTFLKGYQWPFDPDKAMRGGSSLIDILVYREISERGRRVFMDFSQNPRTPPNFAPFDLAQAGAEAGAYLENCGAVQPTPIARLEHMNPLSVDLYAQMGVDLRRDPLPIGVCAQHCNGGFQVDHWWESNLRHLFVIGELAGTHGVKRPGGAALNSGQVGALRAAQRIARVYYRDALALDDFTPLAAPLVDGLMRESARILQPSSAARDARELKRDIQERMTRHAAMVRSRTGVQQALDTARREWRAIREHGLRQEGPGFLRALETRALALAQLGFLEAIHALLERGAGSRGSHLVTDAAGKAIHQRLGDAWRCLPENQSLRKEILGVQYDHRTDSFAIHVTPTRPLPDTDYWFENTWAAYRAGNIFRRHPTDDPKPNPDDK